MRTQKYKISELKPNPKNPRKISDNALKGLEASIREFGYVEPIIVNERTGYIVGGHQRLKALEKQGYDEVDAVIVNLSFEDEMKLNVTLNNKNIQGDWTENIKEVLEDIKIDDEDLFYDLKLDELEIDIGNIDFDKPGNGDYKELEGEDGNKEPKTVECPSCGCAFRP